MKHNLKIAALWRCGGIFYEEGADSCEHISSLHVYLDVIDLIQLSFICLWASFPDYLKLAVVVDVGTNLLNRQLDRIILLLLSDS